MKKTHYLIREPVIKTKKNILKRGFLYDALTVPGHHFKEGIGPKEAGDKASLGQFWFMWLTWLSHWAPAWIRSHNCQLANLQRPPGTPRRLTHKLQYFISFHSAKFFFIKWILPFLVLFLMYHRCCIKKDRRAQCASHFYSVFGWSFFSLGRNIVR